MTTVIIPSHEWPATLRNLAVLYTRILILVAYYSRRKAAPAQCCGHFLSERFHTFQAFSVNVKDSAGAGTRNNLFEYILSHIESAETDKIVTYSFSLTPPNHSRKTLCQLPWMHKPLLLLGVQPRRAPRLLQAPPPGQGYHLSY